MYCTFRHIMRILKHEKRSKFADAFYTTVKRGNIKNLDNMGMRNEGSRK